MDSPFTRKWDNVLWKEYWGATSNQNPVRLTFNADGVVVIEKVHPDGGGSAPVSDRGRFDGTKLTYEFCDADGEQYSSTLTRINDGLFKGHVISNRRGDIPHELRRLDPAESRGGAIGTPDGLRHTSAAFICYRRDDSEDVVGRIYDRLVQSFGRDAVFKDVDSIPLGEDFRQYLSESMGRFAVVLVVIGTKWLSVQGAERLGEDRDFVRIEIESALSLGVPVIPVLVQGATMPKEQDLPPSIARLAYHNGLAVRPDPDFRHDISRLIEGIERSLESLGQVELMNQVGMQGQPSPAAYPEGRADAPSGSAEA